MKTYHNSKSVLQALFAVALMAGSALLAGWTVRSLSNTVEPSGVILLVLAAVFMFVAGIIWIGRIIDRPGHTKPHVPVFALLLTVSGMLLLCFNTGVLPEVWKGFFFSWPMLLFVIGVISACRFHFLSGLVFMLAGAFFLFAKAAVIYPAEPFYDRFTSLYWPVLIILPGIFIFFHTLFHEKRFTCCYPYKIKRGFRENWHNKQSEANKDGKINYQCVFGSIEQVILDPEFKGGDIETTFGGVVLDLRHTSLPEGETFLHIKTVCGGVEITAPRDWHIVIQSPKATAGGVTDSRIKSSQVNPDRKLVIVAECVFGGVVIK
ncbi:MAG: cell wall-active antibiotics response protein [Tannerella sp.]|jgi:predicted membrane protein|nr:cell wall-active antibiotics response protein [Tannerella sp.]